MPRSQRPVPRSWTVVQMSPVMYQILIIYNYIYILIYTYNINVYYIYYTIADQSLIIVFLIYSSDDIWLNHTISIESSIVKLCYVITQLISDVDVGGADFRQAPNFLGYGSKALSPVTVGKPMFMPQIWYLMYTYIYIHIISVLIHNNMIVAPA